MVWQKRYSRYAKVAGAVASAVRAYRKSRATTVPKARSTLSIRTAAKRRLGSRTVTRRKRVSETDTPSAEYTRVSRAMGRVPRKDLRGAWKLLDQNKSTTIYSYRNYSPFGGVNGPLGLLNVSTTPTTGVLTAPMHLWDLTAAPNVVNGTVTLPVIQWVPTWGTPAAGASFIWQNSQNFTVENSDQAATITSQYPNGSDTLNWIQAKMLFYCPTTLPCRYQIDVVQFKDTRLVPDSVTGTNQFASAFYQAMLKRFMYSPLETGNSRYQKYLKVLHTQTFILNPKESTEAVNTIFREVNIFMRLNRRCTYDWSDQNNMALTGAGGQTNTDVAVKTTVHPRARIFLMIRAQSPNASAFLSTIHPSYDIVLRTSHSQMSS